MFSYLFIKFAGLINRFCINKLIFIQSCNPIFQMVVHKSVNHYERMQMPELLAGITERKIEILMGYKEKSGHETLTRADRVKKSLIVNPQDPEQEDEDADLDLTGSPLGADFDPHQKWNLSCPDLDDGAEARVRTGPQYSGVSLAQARAWLSGRGGQEEECWAVTDGADKDRTVYLGSRLEGDTRVMARVISLPPDTSKVISGQLGRVMALHREAGAGQRTVRSQARSELSLVSSSGNTGSSIKVVSSWSKAASLLESPPVDAETLLMVELVAGDEKLDTSQLWTELQLLTGFVRGLSGAGVTWLGGEEEQHTETLVTEVIETIRQIGPRSGVTKLESETLAEQEDLEPFSFKARQEVDFTDILWSNLFKVQSYQQLTEAFKMVFTSLINEEIRPFIYARNNTKSVVKIVNSIVRGSETIPDMSGSLPLELLIECGLEKLRRDYSHSLLNGELASKESIAHLLVSDCPEAALERLHSLHLMVELAVLLETHTKLPSEILRSVLASAQSSSKSEEDTELRRSYKFLVPTQALDMLFVHSPDVWQLKLSSGKKSCEMFTLTLR